MSRSTGQQASIWALFRSHIPLLPEYQDQSAKPFSKLAFGSSNCVNLLVLFDVDRSGNASSSGFADSNAMPSRRADRVSSLEAGKRPGITPHPGKTGRSIASQLSRSVPNSATMPNGRFRRRVTSPVLPDVYRNSMCTLLCWLTNSRRIDPFSHSS